MLIPNKNGEMSLREVYEVFSAYWNDDHRIWVRTTDNIDYNIVLRINDFLHFTQIDKIIKIKSAKSSRKTAYIRNKIENYELTFSSIERSLKSTKQNKHFKLKKQAIICLARSIKDTCPLFQKISFDASVIFHKAKPDYVLIRQESLNRCLLLCNLITKTNQNFLTNLSHVKSLMYCFHKHNRYNELCKYESKELIKAKIVKRKGSK